MISACAYLVARASEFAINAHRYIDFASIARRVCRQCTGIRASSKVIFECVRSSAESIHSVLYVPVQPQRREENYVWRSRVATHPVSSSIYSDPHGFLGAKRKRESTWHLLQLSPHHVTVYRQSALSSSCLLLIHAAWSIHIQCTMWYRTDDKLESHEITHLRHMLLRRGDAALYGRRTLVCMNIATRTCVASRTPLQATPASFVVGANSRSCCRSES